MRPPICPECEQGKCRNCTTEAIDAATDMLLACRCPDPVHVGTSDSDPHRIIYRLLLGSASVGATIPEVAGSTGLPRVASRLAWLTAEGRAVRLSETRSEFAVYVAAGDEQGRQIAGETNQHAAGENGDG